MVMIKAGAPHDHAKVAPPPPPRRALAHIPGCNGRGMKTQALPDRFNGLR
jgi:hypothetical protein